MKNITYLILVVLVGLIFYITTLRGSWGNPETIPQLQKLNAETKPFESSHERAPYAEMLAIKNRGTIELGRELALFASPDVGHNDGKYYSFFPSGVSYLALFFYNIGTQYNLGQIAAYSSSAILGVFTMIFIYLICINVLKLSHWVAITAAFTYAFATTSWSYSITLYQHSAASFFLTSLFYIVWKYKQSIETKKAWLYGSLFWIGYGISSFFDYPNLILLSPLVIYFLISSITSTGSKNKKQITIYLSYFLTGLFFLFIIGFNFYRNQLYFGNWKIYGNSLPRFTIDTGAETTVKQVTKKSQGEYVERYGSIFQEERIPKNLGIMLVGIDKGLFLFSPIFILIFISLYLLINSINIEIFFILTLIFLNWFTYFSFGDPWGGWAYGPRYLIPSMTMMSILAASSLNIIRHKLWKYVYRVFYFILFAVSSSIALAGVLTTNLIPPKVEADYLKLPFYNFMRAFDLIEKGITSNFVYNTFFHTRITLAQYYSSILTILLCIAIILLFVAPIFEKAHETTTKS